MMINRRDVLTLLAASGLSLAGPTLAAAQKRGLPPPVEQALGRYRGYEVVSVRLRRGAPTSTGTMYEVTLSGAGGAERIIYVDPDDGRVLYETNAGRR